MLNVFNDSLSVKFDPAIELMIECMKSIKPRYDIIDLIDPKNTMVFVLGMNLKAAVVHYGARHPSLPDFKIPDYDEHHDLIKPIAEKYKITVERATSDRSVLLKKNLCVYAPKVPRYYGENSLTTTICLLNEHCGVLQGYYVDANSITQDWWNKYDVFPREYLGDKSVAIARIFHALADAHSKQVFAGALRTRMGDHTGYIPYSPYPEYYHPQVQARAGDILLEGGVDTGHTTKRFSEVIGPKGHVFAFEPQPACHAQSQRLLQNAGNVTLENCGLWSTPGELYIASADPGASYICGCSGENTTPCRVIDVDSYLTSKGGACDMIKLDVEGAEPEVIRGAEKTLRAFRPKLAISIYHEPFTQLVDISAQILSLNLGYKLYMGHHEIFSRCGTILYAISERS